MVETLKASAVVMKLPLEQTAADSSLMLALIWNRQPETMKYKKTHADITSHSWTDREYYIPKGFYQRRQSGVLDPVNHWNSALTTQRCLHISHVFHVAQTMILNFIMSSSMTFGFTNGKPGHIRGSLFHPHTIHVFYSFRFVADPTTSHTFQQLVGIMR